MARAHVLTSNHYQTHYLGYGVGGMPNERDALVLHTHDLIAGDFFEPEAAGGVKGLGIRSVVYWTHYIASEIRGWLLDFMERVGTGFTIFYFDQGNDSNFQKVKTLAESQSQQNIILWPRLPGQPHGAAGIERIEPNSTGVDNLLKVIDGYFGAQIRRYIVGQDATSRPVPSGMNSGVAQAHENTFARIVRADALNLDQTLTHQLVRVMQRWTHPGTPTCKFVSAIDKPDVKAYMDGVKAFVDLGGEVDEDEVRSVIGLTKPDQDAKVLGGNKGHHQPGNEDGGGEDTGELRGTVGGLQAIMALQQNFYDGKIPREACMADLQTIFGFSEAEADEMLPQVQPVKRNPETVGEEGGQPPQPFQHQELKPKEAERLGREFVQEYLKQFGLGPDLKPLKGTKKQYAWEPYEGPKGGKGWRNEKGTIVYGDKPGENEGGGTEEEATAQNEAAPKLTSEAKGKVGKLLEATKNAVSHPGQSVKKAVAWAAGKFKAMKEKYGVVGTGLILSAAIVATPIPVPSATPVAIYAVRKLLDVCGMSKKPGQETPKEKSVQETPKKSKEEQVEAAAVAELPTAAWPVYDRIQELMTKANTSAERLKVMDAVSRLTNTDAKALHTALNLPYKPSTSQDVAALISTSLEKASTNPQKPAKTPKTEAPKEAPKESKPSEVRLDPSLSPQAKAHMKEVAKVLKGTDLTPEQRVKYFNAAQDTLKQFNPKALEKFQRNTKGYEFHPDFKQLTQAIFKDHPAVEQKLGKNGTVGGAYDRSTMKLRLDGGGLALTGSKEESDIHDLYSHEFTHAIDGPHHEVSGTREWEDAFNSEIKDRQISVYATTKLSEGLAEFGRLVFSGKVKREEIEKRFPKCVGVWKKHGIWEGVR